jgi:tetratricopeptide (TPR) repeat protein
MRVVHAVLFAAALAAGVSAEEPDALYTRGVYLEVFPGDLEAATVAYRSVLAAPSAYPRLRADATLRLGVCLETLGRSDEARTLAREVMADSKASPSQLNKAKLLLRRLDAPGKAEDIRGQIEHLSEENLRLRKEMDSLEETLRDARARGDEEGRAEKQRLLDEISALRKKMNATQKDRDRLERAVRRLGKPTPKTGPDAEIKNAEEILRRLENEKEIRLEEREFLSDNYYANGTRFRNLGEYDKAIENFRLCLEIWPDHPRARHQILVVEALLGKGSNFRKEPPEVIKEIERQVWESQKRIELSNAFKDGLGFFKIRVYDRAMDRFKKVVNIIETAFPLSEEFHRRRRMAERYIALARREKAIRPSGDDKTAEPVVTHLNVLSFSHSGLSSLFQKRSLDFAEARRPGTRSYVVWAALDPIQIEALLRDALATAGVRIAGKASFILEAGVEETFEKFVNIPYRKPGAAGPSGSALRHGLANVRCGLSMRICPLFPLRRGWVTLDLQAQNALPGSAPIHVRGEDGTRQIPVVFHQSFGFKAEVSRGGGIVVLGLTDPFAVHDPAAPPGESRNLLLIVRLAKSK